MWADRRERVAAAKVYPNSQSVDIWRFWKRNHRAPAAVPAGAERYTCYDPASQAVLVLELVVDGIEEVAVDKRWDPPRAIIAAMSNFDLATT